MIQNEVQDWGSRLKICTLVKFWKTLLYWCQSQWTNSYSISHTSDRRTLAKKIHILLLISGVHSKHRHTSWRRSPKSSSKGFEGSVEGSGDGLVWKSFIILAQIKTQLSFLRVQPSWGSGPYSGSGYPSLSVYPTVSTSHKSSVVEAIAVPEKSWSEIFSDKLDDFIGYFLPDDKPEYEKPAVTSSYATLPTKASFNGCSTTVVLNSLEMRVDDLSRSYGLYMNYFYSKHSKLKHY